jgi:hypothetical protein
MLDTIAKTTVTLAQIPAEVTFVKAPTYPLQSKIQDTAHEAKSAVAYLQELQTVYSEYEELQQKANVALYRFLEGVFKVMVRMQAWKESGKTEAKRLRDTFELIMDERRDQGLVSFTAATSLETKILRFVCGNISTAREKSWVRVLKIALKNENILTKKISFAAWLASEGGVYEVAHTNDKGNKPSEEAKEQVAEAQKLIAEWYGTSVIDEVNDKVLGSLKKDDERFENFTVTLNCYDGNNAKQVIELCDVVSIQRILQLIGKQISEPVRTRQDVQAERDAALEQFIEAGGSYEQPRV